MTVYRLPAQPDPPPPTVWTRDVDTGDPIAWRHDERSWRRDDQPYRWVTWGDLLLKGPVFDDYDEMIGAGATVAGNGNGGAGNAVGAAADHTSET